MPQRTDPGFGREGCQETARREPCGLGWGAPPQSWSPLLAHPEPGRRHSPPLPGWPENSALGLGEEKWGFTVFLAALLSVHVFLNVEMHQFSLQEY